VGSKKFRVAGDQREGAETDGQQDVPRGVAAGHTKGHNQDHPHTVPELPVDLGLPPFFAAAIEFLTAARPWIPFGRSPMTVYRAL
jgi:hypothetical protein